MFVLNSEIVRITLLFSPEFRNAMNYNVVCVQFRKFRNHNVCFVLESKNKKTFAMLCCAAGGNTQTTMLFHSFIHSFIHWYGLIRKFLVRVTLTLITYPYAGTINFNLVIAKGMSNHC